MHHVHGLTGGIASGKSTLAGLLRDRGWEIVDTDEIAHRLMEPGAPNWEKIVDAFGPAVLKSDRTIDRGALGDLVFRDPSLREKLNSLTHPAIRKAWRQERDNFLKTSEGRPQKRMAIVIPLLFETFSQTELENEFENVICVGCLVQTQRLRLQGRGLEGERIEQRLRSQLPIEEKMKRSHRLLWNEGAPEALARQAAWLQA